MAGTGGQSHRRLWEFVFVAVLVLYPLRHIAWGLDLWDTGYGYANFEYMGTRHMDPMWLFSTYLTTVIGHCLSLLPGAKTLIGMNFYTGLSISLLAVLGYYFCTKVLKIPAGLAFLGEFTAVTKKGENRFYPQKNLQRKDVPLPDFQYYYDRIHAPGSRMNISFCWLDYKEKNPDGYEKSQFYEYFNRFIAENYGGQKVSMAVNRIPGEKMYID